MNKTFFIDLLLPRRRDHAVSAGDQTAWKFPTHLAAHIAAFALAGAGIAVGGFMLSGGTAWFAAIPVSTVAGWYVGMHPDLVATHWACSIGAGPII